jgi:hypothetical protein
MQLLCKPGGTIAATTGGAVVSNPHVDVSRRKEMNLTVACYMAQNYAHTTQPLWPGDLTVGKAQRNVPLQAS